MSTSKKEAWIFVGKTGCGKSSTLNLFSDKKAAISDDTTSCTLGTEYFKHKSNESIELVDTRGFSDSHGYDDKKTFQNILFSLNVKDIAHVKIIWCVDGNTR